MRRDDRDDPFGDIFDEIERMMGGGDAGFGDDTHVDVYEEGDRVRLVADLPGVEKGDVSLQCDGATLTIEASGARQYSERVALPTRVDPHSAEASFHNGVLEVAFDAAEDSAAIDVE
jgi:HSP20 family protein